MRFRNSGLKMRSAFAHPHLITPTPHAMGRVLSCHVRAAVLLDEVRQARMPSRRASWQLVSPPPPPPPRPPNWLRRSQTGA
jgi:hypothetical protein